MTPTDPTAEAQRAHAHRLGTWWGAAAVGALAASIALGAASLTTLDRDARLFVEIAAVAAFTALFAYTVGRYLIAEDARDVLAEQLTNDQSLIVLPQIVLSNGSALRAWFQSSADVRIYASGTDTYHAVLRALLADVNRTARMNIRILARDDGTLGRRQMLHRNLRKWEELEGLYAFLDVDVRCYRFRRMLRGIVWDRTAAAIGWYERRGGATIGQEHPAVLVTRTRVETARFIDTAADLFDDLWDRGEQWDDQWLNIPGRVVVLDLDGTLYDSNELDHENARAVAAAVAETRGISVADAEDLVRGTRQDDRGPRHRAPLADAAVRLGVEPSVLAAYQDDMLQPEVHLAPDPELVEAVRELHRLVSIVVLTNAGRRVVDRALDVLGFEPGDFDAILAGEQLENPKPSTADIVRVINQVQGDVRHSVVVGDRFDVDVQPGLELGMDAVDVGGRNDTVRWIRQELDDLR